MKKLIYPIIDTGHGYETTGKESEGFYTESGKVMLKENSVNEAVGNKLSFAFYEQGKSHAFLTNEWYDVSLDERVQRENAIFDKLDKEKYQPFFISLHADAFKQKNKAKGGRFFYYSEKGKAIAEQLTSHLKHYGYDLYLRPPKKANFKVLRETNSPAVLFEMGFMTTEHDLKYLLSDNFRNKTARLLNQAINNLEI